MSEPENFLTRWSRRKREADATSAADEPAATSADATPGAVPPPAATEAEEPVFDLSKLPSLDDVAADTDMSLFMKPGVPAALRHAALRRAWSSDPAIRDFRGLQENDWDFNAPDGVPGFGTFKSEDEIKALAQRMFGPDRREDEPVPQSSPQDSGEAAMAPALQKIDPSLADDAVAPVAASPQDRQNAAQQADDIAVQPIAARRHGGALPQ